MRDEEYKVLCLKEVYAVLDGDTELGDAKEYRMSMPYYTGSQLVDLCRKFGISMEYGASRWVYIEEILKFAIEQGRTNELLQYLFDVVNFSGLSASLNAPDQFVEAYDTICKAAIDKINAIIRLSRKELRVINGNFVIADVGKAASIKPVNIHTVDTPYVRNLQKRCEQDFVGKNYDSVITKSRTLIEEVLIHILESNKVVPVDSGKIKDLYNQVKSLFGMQQSKDYDARINSMLGGLEKIVTAVAEMRNSDSDAHGAGSRRIEIREHEAKLVMDSTITFCEYYLAQNQRHLDKNK